MDDYKRTEGWKSYLLLYLFRIELNATDLMYRMLIGLIINNHGFNTMLNVNVSIIF